MQKKINIFSLIVLSFFISQTSLASRYSEDMIDIFATYCKPVERYNNYAFNSDQSNCNLPKELQQEVLYLSNFEKDNILMLKIRKTLKEWNMTPSDIKFTLGSLYPQDIFWGDVISSSIEFNHNGERKFVSVFYAVSTNQLVLGEAKWVKKGNQEVFEHKWAGDLDNQKIINTIIYSEYFGRTALLSRAMPTNSKEKIDIPKLKKYLNLN